MCVIKHIISKKNKIKTDGYIKVKNKKRPLEIFGRALLQPAAWFEISICEIPKISVNLRLEGAAEPRFDVLHGVAGFLLQLAVPFVLLAVFVVEVVVGELAPLLLGFAFNLVPVAAGFQFGLVVEVVVVEVHGGGVGGFRWGKV